MEDDSRIKILQNTAIISGVFCLVVSLLLLFNYLQFSSKEPLESQAMELMLERLADDPGNEQLKEDIRDLDMLARKAYFNSQWQIRTGSYLLLFGAIVFAISLRYLHSLRSRIPEPEEEGKEVFRGGILTQRWILGTGLALIIAALGTAFITVNKLDSYGEISSISPLETETGEGIEVIDLSETGNTPDPAAESQTGIEHIDEPAGDESSDQEVSDQEVSAQEVSAQAIPDQEASDQANTESSPGQPAQSKQSPAPGSPGPLNKETIMAGHNSFRGPWGNGVSGHTNLPVDWDGASGRAIVWKVQLDKQGYNSPVVWGDMIFLSGADEAGQVIYCYNRNTGRLIWEAETGEITGSPARKPDVTEDTGLAAPGMTTDGSRVFAIFATGDVVCFDMNGTRLWARNLGVPDNHYGHSSSLIVWDGKLFVQFDSNRGGRVLALNTKNGESIWDTRRTSGISWASPILVEHKGKMQLILSSEPIVAGYDIDNGEELWTVKCMMGEVGPSPAYYEGIIYAANEYARLVAINLDNPSEIIWEDNEYLPEVSSPVASEGLLFIATSYGVFACYDAKNGTKLWEQEYGHGFYSSPLIAEGKVYALDMGGNMHIFNVSREYSLAGEASLGEKAYSTPAFADGKIYIRGEKHLFCIGK